MQDPKHPAATNPTELAREALRVLAKQRVPPTPDNYRKVYREIAGTTSTFVDAADSELRDAAGRLPASAPWRAKARESVDSALISRDWEGAREAISKLVGLLHETPSKPAATLPPSWKHQLAELFRQWDSEHAGWTRARKRKSIENALDTSIRDPGKILLRLHNAVAQWKDSKARSHSAPEPLPGDGTPSDIVSELRRALAKALEGPLAALVAHDPQLTARVRSLADSAREATDAAAARELTAAIDALARLIADNSGDEAHLRKPLLKLLRLLVDNMHQLLAGDAWLRSQLDIMRGVFSEPLTDSAIADAQNAMRALMAKQVETKDAVETARDDLKALAHTLIDRLGKLATTTDAYHGKLQDYDRRIDQTDDIQSLGALLRDLMTDTRSMQQTTAKAHTELRSVHQRAERADQSIRDMGKQLTAMTQRTREDLLTGVMNRRALETTFDHRAAEADKDAEPMCAALVDVDNFKALNDRLGDVAGDAALRHLVGVVREHLRPQDRIARYSGEEFVLLLPDTDENAAVDLMTRLQRQLTKHFFMYKQERTLITFSCGVALRATGESLRAVLARANQAMIAAKSAGKNRVVSAATLHPGARSESPSGPEMAP
jgi:diguanylate cyclase